MKTYKLEIIVAQLFLEELLEELKHAKITGYTCLNIKQSMGVEQGEILDDVFNDSIKKVLVFTLIKQDQTAEVFDVLNRLRKRFRVVYFTSEIELYLNKKTE